MKMLSVKQPWASKIASGKKTIETRRWSTKYRGEILIVSSLKSFPWLKDKLPCGVTMAVCKIVDCRPMTKEDEVAACCEVYPKAHSWVLEDIREVKNIPVKGGLGLRDVPEDIVRML